MRPYLPGAWQTWGHAVRYPALFSSRHIRMSSRNIKHPSKTRFLGGCMMSALAMPWTLCLTDIGRSQVFHFVRYSEDCIPAHLWAFLVIVSAEILEAKLLGQRPDTFKDKPSLKRLYQLRHYRKGSSAIFFLFLHISLTKGWKSLWSAADKG